MSGGRAIRTHLGDERGVTLSEMLVVLVILGIVLGGMTTLFVSAATSQRDQTNRVDAQQNARVALDALRREIRCGSSVPAVSQSSITVALPARCQVPPGVGAAPITWCTVGGAAPYTLWRYDGATCSGDGRPVADSLYSDQLFVLNRQNPVGAPTLTASKPTGSTEVVFTPGRYAYSVTAIVGGKEVPGTVASTLVATDTANRITLTWPAYGGATKYRVYGRDDGATTAAGLRLIGEVVGTPPATTYLDLGAPAGSTESPAPVSSTALVPPRTTLSISLVLDTTEDDDLQRFTLTDDIVLRNSGRG